MNFQRCDTGYINVDIHTDYESVKACVNSDGIIDELNNMVFVALAAQSFREGKLSMDVVKPVDERFSCATLDIHFFDDHSIDEHHGELRIRFDGICNAGGVIYRKGILVIGFKGNPNVVNSTVTWSTNTFMLENGAIQISALHTQTIDFIVQSGNTSVIAQIDSLHSAVVVFPKNIIKCSWKKNVLQTRVPDDIYSTTWEVAGNAGLIEVEVVEQENVVNKVTFSRTYDKQNIYFLNCFDNSRDFFPVSGTLKYINQLDKKKPIGVDYGNGKCNDNIIFTKSGISISITDSKNK